MYLRTDCIFQTATVILMKEVRRISKKNSTSQPFRLLKNANFMFQALQKKQGTVQQSNWIKMRCKMDAEAISRNFILSFYGIHQNLLNSNVFRHMKTKASPRTCTNFFFVCLRLHSHCLSKSSSIQIIILWKRSKTKSSYSCWRD